MNKYKTNYKTVITVTEEGLLTFSTENAKKLAILKSFGMTSGGTKEFKQSSHSSEYEIMADLYWTINKALLTETSGSNVIGSFGMNVGKTLTEDNFKVILITIDFIR